MKATDLMIGDWAIAHSKPIRLIGVYDDCINGCRVYTEDGSDIREENIEPVSLTEEALKANGFIKRTHLVYQVPSYSRPKSYLFVHPCYEESKDRIAFVPNNDGVTLYCKYVHELQHALRLCGLNDLADNFKLKV